MEKKGIGNLCSSCCLVNGGDYYQGLPGHCRNADILTVEKEVSEDVPRIRGDEPLSEHGVRK